MNTTITGDIFFLYFVFYFIYEIYYDSYESFTISVLLHAIFLMGNIKINRNRNLNKNSIKKNTY